MGISAAMQNHLNGTTSLAVFMKLTAKDGDVLRVCNTTRDKIVNGELYHAYPIAPSTLQTTNGLKPDNLEVTAIYSGLFTAATLRAKKWLGARMEYRVMNYRDFSMGHAFRSVGFVGQVTVGNNAAKPELKSLSQKLSEPVGRTCNEDCDATLGDARCRVDLNGNTATGYRIKTNAHVVAVLNQQQFSIALDQPIKPSDTSILTAPNNLYRFGRIKFNSGANSMFEGQVLFNEGNALTLTLPLFYNLQPGDGLTVTAGCDQKIGTCRDLYANAVNNRSFWCLPGRSKLLKIPD